MIMGTQAGKTEACELASERIIGLIENRIIPWHYAWTNGGLPQNMATRRPYKGVNAMLLHGMGYSSNYFLTYDQLVGLGGRVRANQEPNLVLCRTSAEFRDVEPDEWEPPRRKHLRHRHVFNVCQCDGLPKDAMPPVARRHNPLQACANIVAMMPNAPEILDCFGDPYYHPFQDTVYASEEAFETGEEYYAGVFRELVHSTGHEKRLDREGLFGMREYSASDYTMEELVAEIGACMLASFAGIQIEPKVYDGEYAHEWVQRFRKDSEFVVRACAKAQAAAEYVLGLRGRRLNLADCAAVKTLRP